METGRVVLAVAPTMSAVEEFQKVGFTDAITVERVMQDPRIRSEIRGKVIILDEAGMVSARQMAELLRLAEDCSLRVVFSGDTKQIRSVEAGDALRILQKESRLKTVALTQVQRQTRKDYRDAMEELRRNPERGFAKLDAMGAVREAAISERAAAIADAYDSTKGTSTLVVCATHDEIDRVTEAIRERRKTRGELGEGVSLTRHVSLNWTAGQKADFRSYRAGQFLGFHRAVESDADEERSRTRLAPDTGGVVIAGGAKPLFRHMRMLFASISFVVVIAAGWLIRDSAIYERTDEAQVDGRILPLSALINGHVQQINVVDGQLVHAGDVLSTIDQRAYSIAVLEALAKSCLCPEQCSDVAF